MRLAIIVVIISVIAGTTIGYLVGSNLPTNREASVILANTRLERIRDDKFVMNYVCNGRVLASFDVDTDALVSTRLAAKEIDDFATQSANRSRYQRIYDVVIGALTGGGALKWGRPLVTTLKAKDNAKYTVPGMIGALTGFYLGYSLATINLGDCYNPLTVSLVQEPKIWLFFKGQLASDFLLQVIGQSVMAPSQDGPSENAVAQSMRDITEHKVNSQTFSRLFAIATYIPPPNEPTHWYSFDLIVTVYVPVAILVIGAIFAAFLITQRVEAQRQKAHAKNKEIMQ
jgi:hypothetical protein